MEPRTTVLRGRDGREHVLLELADFQALVDAANAAAHGLPDVEDVLQRLIGVLDQVPAESIDLAEFLAEYDALHGEG
jgi:hypothetical protein